MITKHKDMYFDFAETEKGKRLSAFNVGEQLDFKSGNPCLLTSFGFSGKPFGFHSAISQGYAFLTDECEEKETCLDERGGYVLYRHSELDVELKVNIEFVPGANVVRQNVVIKNVGTEERNINHLASAFIGGIATDGILPWYDKRKIKVHYCRQSWNGEGQWRSASVEDLGLYETSNHPSVSGINISSIGTWSTGQYWPVVFLEDMETGKIWYFQVESSSNWHIEIGYRSGWDGRGLGFFVQCDAASERYGGWNVTLKPDEEFVSEPVAYGCCVGGFESAVRELTIYRRTILKADVPWGDGYCPVTFNDYMNCLWGNPTTEMLEPLVDAAAKAGVECFCIDAGWYTDKVGGWGSGLGDWNPSRDRFEGGLKNMLQYISGKGLIPGVWLEMEVCSEGTELGKKPDSWFLMRTGYRVGGGERWFLNYTNPDVREYMHTKIDALVEMGVGFIKNDYNASVGNGDDVIDPNAPNGMLIHTRAFRTFVDEVRVRHPQLIIENCGSGGMRSDYGMLSHFHLQSFSDQEDYRRNPSVLGGCLANILPEHLGVWAYPMPLLSGRSLNEVRGDVYRATMADGEQTVFNMISGMCGNMYVSGHIEEADEYNFLLIKEAVDLYKKERTHIHNGFPVWPLGFTNINDKDTWAVVGIENEDKSRILLAVWRLDNADETKVIPLVGMVGVKAKVTQLYPSRDEFVSEYCYNESNGCLSVRLEKRYSARYFEIVKE